MISPLTLIQKAFPFILALVLLGACAGEDSVSDAVPDFDTGISNVAPEVTTITAGGPRAFIDPWATTSGTGLGSESQ